MTAENRGEACPSPPVGGGGGGSRSESGSATPTRLGAEDDPMQGVDPSSNLPINVGDPTLNMSISPSMSPAETVQVVPRLDPFLKLSVMPKLVKTLSSQKND